MADKFTKSRDNQKTQKEGLGLLLSDPRFQSVDAAVKTRILELIGKSDEFGIQTFDAVMTPEPVGPITLANIDEHFPTLRLIEMKTTRGKKRRITDAGLSGFFFGATQREYSMAAALGDRYLFAFVVLSEENDYRKPFAVLLTLEEVEARTQSKRTQFQVNFRSNIDPEESNRSLIVFGDVSDIPPEPL